MIEIIGYFSHSRFRHGYCKGNPRKMVKTWAEKEMRNLIRWLTGVCVSVSVCAVSACQSRHLAPSRSAVILSRPGTLRARPVPEMCRGKQRRGCWASRNHLLSLSHKAAVEEFCHGWVTWKALGASWEGFEFTVRVIKSLQDLKQGSDIIRLGEWCVVFCRCWSFRPFC